MSEETKTARVTVHVNIGEIPPAAWNACANPVGAVYNPFLDHDFLAALEESGSVSPRRGWAPCHLALRTDCGDVRAVMPCYLKSHSQGEYVFDHAWANAYERAGGNYYPKLQTAVPFTPATGRRVLIKTEQDEAEARALLAAAAIELGEKNGASSWHITFPTEKEWSGLGEIGLLRRTGTQYHWFNEGYASFDDFLATLASRKRKGIRKEREQARGSGVDIRWLSGSEITEAEWDVFFKFYIDTGNRKWGTPYLTRKFFSLIGQRMGGRILLVMCYRDGKPIAGALNLIGGDTLYGRYWGCLEDHSFLHFEACYYQAIDYAIANKMRCVEAGAQGEHKLARGYRPCTTYSLHHFADPGLARAVAHYLEREREAVAEEQIVLEDMTPYKRTDKTAPCSPKVENGEDG